MSARLAGLALEVAAVAPLNAGRDGTSAYIPWRTINLIRAELEELGVDWRAFRLAAADEIGAHITEAERKAAAA
jgi:hypothetical protein